MPAWTGKSARAVGAPNLRVSLHVKSVAQAEVVKKRGQSGSPRPRAYGNAVPHRTYVVEGLVR